MQDVLAGVERAVAVRAVDSAQVLAPFYYYFMDRDLGLIHVKLQTWLPFRIQVYVNGHEWLARNLDRNGIKYLKNDNAFMSVSDFAGAQRLAYEFERVDWIRVLGGYAAKVNPLLTDVLAPMQYYWVTAQAEYSTDIMFGKRADLDELMPRLCPSTARCTSAPATS